MAMMQLGSIQGRGCKDGEATNRANNSRTQTVQYEDAFVDASIWAEAKCDAGTQKMLNVKATQFLHNSSRCRLVPLSPGSSCLLQTCKKSGSIKDSTKLHQGCKMFVWKKTLPLRSKIFWKCPTKVFCLRNSSKNLPQSPETKNTHKNTASEVEEGFHHERLVETQCHCRGKENLWFWDSKNPPMEINNEDKCTISKIKTKPFDPPLNMEPSKFG